MAIIPQLRIFGWKEIEELGDLKRLRLVLKYMPDEELMRQMEQERYKGRDDYPVRHVEFPIGRNSLPTRNYRKTASGISSQRTVTRNVRFF